MAIPQPVDTRFLTEEQAAGVAKAKATVAGLANQGQQVSTQTQTGTDPFLAELQKNLLKTSSLVSSGQTQLQDRIGEAIGGVEKGQVASAQRIESQFGRERAFAETEFGQQREDLLARQRGTGLATTQAALGQLDTRTEKSLRDLDQRKQELILAGESSAAQQISGLQMEALRFQQDAAQQQFNNLISTGTFARQVQDFQLRAKQEARASSAQQIQQGLDRERFTFEKATTLEQQRVSQIRLNIANAELKLKQVAEGQELQPDPGFGSVTIQNQLGANANARLTDIQQKVETGRISIEEEEALTIQAYMDARREATVSQASDDALAGLFGLRFDDETGELGFSESIDVSDTTLPGETGGGFLDFLGSTFFGESPDRQRFNALDKRFRAGEDLSSTEMAELRELGKKAGVI